MRAAQTTVMSSIESAFACSKLARALSTERVFFATTRYPYRGLLVRSIENAYACSKLARALSTERVSFATKRYPYRGLLRGPIEGSSPPYRG